MKEQKLESYFGRKIAIDASMSIYQFLVRAARASEGFTGVPVLAGDESLLASLLCRRAQCAAVTAELPFLSQGRVFEGCCSLKGVYLSSDCRLFHSA